jgi:hypothetical protein
MQPETGNWCYGAPQRRCCWPVIFRPWCPVRFSWAACQKQRNGLPGEHHWGAGHFQSSMMDTALAGGVKDAWCFPGLHFSWSIGLLGKGWEWIGPLLMVCTLGMCVRVCVYICVFVCECVYLLSLIESVVICGLTSPGWPLHSGVNTCREWRRSLDNDTALQESNNNIDQCYQIKCYESHAS